MWRGFVRYMPSPFYPASVVLFQLHGGMVSHMQVLATPSSTVHNAKYLDPYHWTYLESSTALSDAVLGEKTLIYLCSRFSDIISIADNTGWLVCGFVVIAMRLGFSAIADPYCKLFWPSTVTFNLCLWMEQSNPTGG